MDGALLDWEGWGRAPPATTPHCSWDTPCWKPALAASLRTALAHLLDTPAGRAAQLVVATELLQSVNWGDHPELKAPLRDLVAAVA
ncbi:hypothetical protein ACWGNE_09360 [Streptomyces xiamenensis]